MLFRSQYPDIAPPTVQVRATYTGANSTAVLNSVIAPLEDQIPKAVRFYVTYILPIIVLVIFVFGYNDKFKLWDKLVALLGM